MYKGVTMFAKNEKALSDHSPYSMAMKTEKGNYNFLSWNMMNQMKLIQDEGWGKKWQYINNGFGCVIESKEAYETRLELIASRLQVYIKIVNPV